MSAFSNVDAQALQEKMAAPLVLIDVRSDREVERGMIPGALHIALHTLPSRLHEIEKDRPVAIYCQSGARSAQASHFLAQNGWTEVYNLAGGYSGWMARGFAVTQV